jgi:SAM-dependent methyltransferase
MSQLTVAFAEFERSMIRQRVKAGLKLAVGLLTGSAERAYGDIAQVAYNSYRGGTEHLTAIAGASTKGTTVGGGEVGERLRAFASSEATVWEGSPYYDEAEQWTHLFWSADQPFRPMFEGLDLDCLVELACGRGRHAQQVIGRADLHRYVGVDILPSNIEACRQRIGDKNHHISFDVTDGVSPPLNDGEASAVFCYDAMVHFDLEIILAYLRDTARILRPGGRALFHHSNYSSNPGNPFALNPMARSFMSLDLFAHLAHRAGLYPIEQRTIPWGNFANIDGLTLLERPPDGWHRPVTASSP